MGRRIWTFCPRASMPMPMPMIDSEESAHEPTDNSTMPSETTMTWQQQQDFGHSKGKRRGHNKKWRPFNQAAAEDTAGSGNAWSALQAEMLPDLIHSNQPEPGKISVPTSTYTPTGLNSKSIFTTDTTKEQGQADNMADLPESAYIPPNRRKFGAANGATAPQHDSASGIPAGSDKSKAPNSEYIPPNRRNFGSANGMKAGPALQHDTAHGTPSGSDKSKAHMPNQLRSSPENAKLTFSSPLTLPTTAPEVKKAKPVSHDPLQNRTAQWICQTGNSDESQKLNDNGEWPGWDKPKTNSPPPVQRNNNPRWPRGPKAAPKKTVWPKARDMKYIPGNTDSDGGVTFKSNSNGDPDYDVKKLLDWNGDWMPPPEQWSARNGFTNRHFGQSIENWINGHPEFDLVDLYVHKSGGHETTNAKGGVQHDSFDSVCKEIVPRYWLTATVERKPLGAFWKEYPDRAPKAVSDIDITEHAPWWSRYEDSHGYFINALVVPDALADPEDPANHVNTYSFASAEDKVQEINARAERKKRRMIARHTRPISEPRVIHPPVEDKRIRLGSNVYLRPVQPADVRGITDIYNYYIENSVYAPEFESRTESQIRDRINLITSANLPYLVAVAKSSPREKLGYITEKIAGYISLNDHCHISTMYRYTFDMDLCVHPGYTHKNIAKCLLDRLLEMCNTNYNARGGYEYINEYDYLKNGPGRVIKTILLYVHHKHEDDMKWASEYLSAFKFIRAGHISHIAYKHNQIVDRSIFQHHTSEPINKDARPAVPLQHI